MMDAAYVQEQLDRIDMELAAETYGYDRDRLLDERLQYQHGLDLIWQIALARC